MRILFAYKGRYQVRTACVLEVLSALAKARGFQTGLAHDPDVFGATDNVFPSRRLSRFFRSDARVLRVVGKAAPDLLVFVEDCNPDAWGGRIAAAAKALRPAVATVVVSPKDREGLAASFDHVLLGEPEAVFPRFLDARGFEGRKSRSSSDELADLDALPLPDKTLFARSVDFSESYLVCAGKGCPFRCTYCEETVGARRFGDGYCRVRRPEKVIEELAWARKTLGSREVTFKDSVLTWDKAWLSRFLALYPGSVGVPFKCFAKAQGFDRETALLLKGAGCYCVEFGVQTFNEALRRDVLGRSEKNETLMGAFAACAEAGLRFDADHLFGIPGESLADHRQAAAAYAGLKLLNRVKCFNLVYYPDAEIGRSRPPGRAEEPSGREDFFSHTAGSPDMAPVNAAFEKMFKVLPLLGERRVKALAGGSRWRAFSAVPSPVVIALQALLAAKNRDLRFRVYASGLPRRMRSLLAS